MIEPNATQAPVSTPEEMLNRLRMGKKMVYDVAMGSLIIPMRVLSMDEEAAVRREAKKQVMLKGGDETDQNIEIQKSTIKLATTMGAGQFPMISDALLTRMTSDEHTYLYEEYIVIRDRVNPSLEKIGNDEFLALVECLKKNIVSVNDLSSRQRKVICGAFVELIQRPVIPTSPTDS